MNPVLADPPARHDHQVTGSDFFCVRGPAVDSGRHDSGCAAVYERLAQVSLVKDDAAVDGRDAAFVAAMFDAFPHALINPSRMQDAGRQLLFVERRGKAKHICVKNQFGSQACAEGIAVDADNAGERPSVRIERRGRIMRFDLKDEIVMIIELDDSRVINKNGEAEILFPFGFTDSGR